MTLVEIRAQLDEAHRILARIYVDTDDLTSEASSDLIDGVHRVLTALEEIEDGQ